MGIQVCKVVIEIIAERCYQLKDIPLLGETHQPQTSKQLTEQASFTHRRSTFDEILEDTN